MGSETITTVLPNNRFEEASAAMYRQDDNADAPRRAIGRQITLRVLSGALRRPSRGCSGQVSTRTRSGVRPPLIRRPVRRTAPGDAVAWRSCGIRQEPANRTGRVGDGIVGMIAVTTGTRLRSGGRTPVGSGRVSIKDIAPRKGYGVTGPSGSSLKRLSA